MGGPSTEREISLKSGKAVYESLAKSGLDAVLMDIQTDSRDENIRLISRNKIDCAFIALHGRFGEDGGIQEILDGLNIPYTGSGVCASRLAMDKVASRRIFAQNGLSVPGYSVISKSSYRRDMAANTFKFPAVVKPVAGGSSIGLSMVDTQDALRKALNLAFDFDEKALIEEYLSGREMTVGVLADTALPVIEIIPKNRFFDYEAKYRYGMTDYVAPAQIDAKTASLLQGAALSAHRLLGCYGCSRADIIISGENTPFVLEVNTIPGMTETSLLPKAAKVAGLDFAQLCVKLIQLAYEKK